MRRLFVQFLVAAASIGIVLFVLSLFGLVTFGANGLAYVVVLGLILAVANVTVRPVLLLLTGRWLISSFGLALIVIDTVVLLVAAWLSPRTIAVRGAAAGCGSAGDDADHRRSQRAPRSCSASTGHAST